MTFVKDKLESTKPPHNHTHTHDPTYFDHRHHPAPDHPEMWNKLLKDRRYWHSHPHTDTHVFSSVSDSTDNGFFGVSSDVDVGYEEEMPDLDLPVCGSVLESMGRECIVV